MGFNISIDAADKATAKRMMAEAPDVKHGHVPDAARTIIESAVDALPDLERSAITISAHGHFQPESSRGTSNFTITVGNRFSE